MRSRIALLLGFLLLITACSRHEKVAGLAAHAGDAVAYQAPQSQEEARKAVSSSPMPRMVIRNARLSLVVTDVVSVSRKLFVAAEARGGYIANSREWRENDQTRASIQARVPSAQLNAFLAETRALARRVDAEEVGGDDVSQEYVDLTSRQKNLEATEIELRALLSTVRQKMQKAEDILRVHTELERIRGEIEQIKGRVRYLEQMTSYSTVQIELTPDALATPITKGGWQAAAVAHNALQALVETLQLLATIAIWLGVYVLPIALLLLMIALPVRYVRRRAAAA